LSYLQLNEYLRKIFKEYIDDLFKKQARIWNIQQLYFFINGIKYEQREWEEG
jgi:hypothetical protein